MKSKLGIIGACLGLILPLSVDIGGESLSYPGQIALGVFLMAGVLWITEAGPIWSTSLLVIFLQVVLLSNQSLLLNTTNLEGYQPLPYQDFYANLAHPIIILFLGGFYLAAAAVKFSLDKNLTRVMLGLFGRQPEWVLLGLLLSTGTRHVFTSMPDRGLPAVSFRALSATQRWTLLPAWGA